MAEESVNRHKEDDNTEESANQRLKLLYLYKILSEQTDEEHYLTMPQIIDELKKFGINAARKALYKDIEALHAFGVDVNLERRKNMGYNISTRKFEIPELVLLADAVTCSRFFTREKAEALVQKLNELCSVHEAKKINSSVFILNGDKVDDDEVYLNYYNVDAIHRAIYEKKQISFKYYDYDLKKRKTPRGGTRECSPYALTWDDEKYYLIAYYPKYNGISHFRVDKMGGVEVLDKPRHELAEGTSLSGYMESTFSMFSGDAKKVTLRFENALIGAVIDRFGRKIDVSRDDMEHFIVEATVRTEHPQSFFGWIFQFGDRAEILAPQDLKEQYIKTLRKVLEKETES